MTSPLATFAMRPLVSSSVLYVDLLLRISTTSTTPSSHGMSVVATRSSWPRFSAWVMEAILSTTHRFHVGNHIVNLGKRDHCVHCCFPALAQNIPGKPTIFEKPSASAAVHSPAASPYTPFDAAMIE